MERVAFGVTTPRYASEPPFHPDEQFPELRFDRVSQVANPAYRKLRALFLRLGYDAHNYGTSDWNPLGTIVRPGQTVLLKPNFVMSRNPVGDLFACVTHPSILRALIDYSFIALNGTGRIIIADAPQMHCDWDELMVSQRLGDIQDFYRQHFNFDIEVYDLREFSLLSPDRVGYASDRRQLPGGPEDSVVVNLGRRSEFYGLPSDQYYGADYDRSETIKHHQGETQEYCVSRTILAADVVISVPKMKVHKKVGVTLNLKGLVGINTNKNYLIHYRLGCPSQGGDQLPDGQRSMDRFLVGAQRFLFDHALARQNSFGEMTYRAARHVYRTCIKPFRPVSASTVALDGGNWYGNDSAWRMTVDLAKILYFCDVNGSIHDSPQRKLLCVVDGVIGGEKDGPLQPSTKKCGALVVGRDPFAVDMVTTRMMGFDIGRLRQLDWCFTSAWPFPVRSPSDIEILSEDETISGDEFFSSECLLPHFGFVPHPGWVGHIELEGPTDKLSGRQAG